MGSVVSAPQTKEDKQKEILKWAALCSAIGGVAVLVYVLGYREPKPKRKKKQVDGELMKIERKPFLPIVTSPQDQEVKMEIKRKITGFKGVAPVTIDELTRTVEQFEIMMSTKDWSEGFDELAATVRKMRGFEAQFDAKLRLGAARILHARAIFHGLQQSQGIDVDLSDRKDDLNLARHIIDFNPDILDSQGEYEKFMMAKMDICNLLHEYGQMSQLFKEAMDRSNFSAEFIFTLVSHSLVLGEWDAFLKIYKLGSDVSPGFEKIFRDLATQGKCVLDVKAVEMLLRNERPKFHPDPDSLQTTRYVVSMIQVKLIDVTGDDVAQVQEMKESLMAMYSDWRNESSELEQTLMVDGAMVTGANLFPDTTYVFCGYWDEGGRSLVMQKVDDNEEIQRYELKYSSSDAEGDWWTGKLTFISPREKVNNNNSLLPAGVICEFSASMRLQRQQV